MTEVKSTSPEFNTRGEQHEFALENARASWAKRQTEFLKHGGVLAAANGYEEYVRREQDGSLGGATIEQVLTEFVQRQQRNHEDTIPTDSVPKEQLAGSSLPWGNNLGGEIREQQSDGTYKKIV